MRKRMVILAGLVTVSSADRAAATERLWLWRDGVPQARWIAYPLPKPMRDIADVTFNGTLAEFFGWTLPRAFEDDEPGTYVLAGWEENHPVLRRLVAEGLELRRETLGDEGFRILTHASDGRRYLIVTANTAAGIKFGLQELLFFHTPATSDGAWVETPLEVTRRPAFAYRGIYMLPCWAAHDRAYAWKRVLDFNSELTVNRVWFWLAGFHLLAQYGGEYEHVDLADPWHVSLLVDHCRDLGMKFYIGGGWFTWHHDRIAQGSIERGVEYYLDMLKLLPEAEGIYLEPAGEGRREVADEVWRRRLDALEGMAERIWSRRPEFEFAVAVGRRNSPAYREALHAIDEQRIHWWWCWGDPLQDNALQEHPLMLRWHTVVQMSDYHGSTAPPRPEESSLTGIATSYDPGMGFGNPWNGWAAMGIDNPREFDPYHLPYFAHQYRYRERCWDLDQSDQEFAARLQHRLFDDDMPENSITHYLNLSDYCFAPGGPAEADLDAIGAFLDAHENHGTYRNRRTLGYMKYALKHLRAHRQKQSENAP